MAARHKHERQVLVSALRGHHSNEHLSLLAANCFKLHQKLFVKVLDADIVADHHAAED